MDLRHLRRVADSGPAILDPTASSPPRRSAGALAGSALHLAADKTPVRVARAETPLGVPSGGYEIHHGLTDHGGPLFLRADRAYPSEAERICGYVSRGGALHGVLTTTPSAVPGSTHVRADIGLTPQRRCLASYDLEKGAGQAGCGRCARHPDMETIYQSMGLK